MADLADVHWRGQRRLSGWRVGVVLGTGDDNGDFAPVDWRQQWRLSRCGLETTWQT